MFVFTQRLRIPTTGLGTATAAPADKYTTAHRTIIIVSTIFSRQTALWYKKRHSETRTQNSANNKPSASETLF